LSSTCNLLAQLQVERAERLVEEQHRGVVDERAGQRDALLLAAGELARAGALAAAQADELERLGHTALDLGHGHLAALEAERDVAAHVEVLEERVALEHRVDVAPVRRHVGDGLALEQDPSLARLLESGDHAQRRRLAAARGAEQGEELAAGDREVHVAHRGVLAEALPDALDRDGGVAIGAARRRADRGAARRRGVRHAPSRPSSTPSPLSRRPSRRGSATARPIVRTETASIRVPIALIVGVTPKRIAE
jgi:hypothetical protein